MNISNYLQNRNSINGAVISLFIADLYKENKYKDILFVRTCTTGAWLDKLLIGKDVNRILYYTDTIKEPTTSHPSTQIVHSNNVENQLLLLNKTFDMICVDTWHEYDLSSRDFRILSSFLNESGILISHDCYPWNIQVANPKFIRGNWCGETYLAFIEFAHHNPALFYAVLNIDTGIGIASKTPLHFLSNTLNREKQEQLLFLHKHSEDYYSYFIKHSKEIINALT
jgi:hypothetical protein